MLLLGCMPTPRWPAPVELERHGATATSDELAQALIAAPLVCVGEQHDEAAHHGVQEAILRYLIETRGEEELALGMEMFQRAQQPVLDGFVRGTVDEPLLLSLTEWEKNWGYDAAMYRPLWHTAHAHGVRLIGLNAPRELTRMVARRGLAALAPELRAALPELVLDDAEHRHFFDAAMGDGFHGTSDNVYAAQVVWDEVMAETASAWLSGGGRKMLVVAGNGHCHESAIVRRVERRLSGTDALSVLVTSGALPADAASDYVITVDGG